MHIIELLQTIYNLTNKIEVKGKDNITSLYKIMAMCETAIADLKNQQTSQSSQKEEENANKL